MQSKVLNRRNSKKGFTLMEMLIVVAIIAILVAIAIPTFSAQLNKARIAADSANIRAAYAMVQTCNLLETDPNGGAEPTADTVYYLLKDGTFESSVTVPDNAYKCQGESVSADTAAVYAQGWAKGDLIKITYTKLTDSWDLNVDA